jgi:opacity protein-like surface antigen
MSAMRDRFRIRRSTVGIVIAAVVTLSPSTVLADATLFLGANTTPSTRWTRGGAVGISLLIVGFEFEYSNTSEELEDLAPSLRTGMANVLVQTPFTEVQFYGTIGGGLYRERLAGQQETHFGANVGGGVKVPLAGPLRLRFDYRIFTLQGSPRHSKPQRIYAGVNLMF